MRLLLFSVVLIFFSGSGMSQSLSVMSYNIRYDNPNDGVNQWRSRKEKVYTLIRKYDPEILGVQEALHHQLKDIESNLSTYAFVGVGRDDGKEKGEYSAIFYKKDMFEVIDQNTFWLSETPEIPGSKSWDAAITRVATWAKLRDKKTRRKFLIINTHFDHIGKEARAKSAELIKLKAAELGRNMPVIVTGDFNCTRDDLPYSTMVAVSSELQLFDAAPKNDPQGTFCNFGVNSQPCRTIDYIFHSKEWRTESYMVPTDNDGKYYPSDHLPVMAKLGIK